MNFLDQRQQLRARNAIDLVHRDDCRTPQRSHIDQHRTVPGMQSLARLDDCKHHFTLSQRAPGHLHHPLIHRFLCEVKAGRVDEQNLCVSIAANSQNAAARGLRPRRYDRDLLSDDSIDQR